MYVQRFFLRLSCCAPIWRIPDGAEVLQSGLRGPTDARIVASLPPGRFVELMNETIHEESEEWDKPDVSVARLESEDLQSLYAYCSEPDTGIHADKKPHESIEESRQLLNQLMQEDLTWAICDKVSGKNIGAVWLREDHRRRRDKSRCRVLGYLLDKGWWGQGLMTEAVSCVVDYAFKDLQLELISTTAFLITIAAAG